MSTRNKGCSCANLLTDFVQGDQVEVSTACQQTLTGTFEKFVNSDVIQLRVAVNDAQHFVQETEIINICCKNICSISKTVIG